MPELERLVSPGPTRIVLHNTYLSRASRTLVMQAAASVGSGPQDPGFARRLGFQYRDAKDCF